MDVTAGFETSASPEDLFAVVEDLGRYREWLEIVARAVPAEADGGDPGPAWTVDLRARLGPFARAKRLRMVRAAHEPHHRVRFERRELDGRSHSPWVLDADVADLRGQEDRGTGTRLTMRLHYGGRLWMPVLDRVLREEINRSKPRLRSLLERGGPTSGPPRG